MNVVFSAIAAVAVSTSAAQAATFSFAGEFVNDNDVFLIDFSVDAPTDVTFRSFSYAGGTQADGNIVSAGGFDPVASLFSSAGILFAQQDIGPGVPIDPTNGAPFDVNLTVSLPAGTYSASLTQFNNFSLGTLTDGFSYDAAHFTNFTSIIGCSNQIFCDITTSSRNGSFAFDISGIDDAIVVRDPTPALSVVPLPAGMPLMLAGLGAFAFTRRKKPV